MTYMPRVVPAALQNPGLVAHICLAMLQCSYGTVTHTLWRLAELATVDVLYSARDLTAALL